MDKCKNINTHDEALSIKKYIRYVRIHVLQAKTDIIQIPDNEYQFYYHLNERIKEFLNNHLIWYKYIFGKIDTKYGMRLLGYPERNFMRRMENQRKDFIQFATTEENKLSREYNFYGTMSNKK